MNRGLNKIENFPPSAGGSVNWEDGDAYFYPIDASLGTQNRLAKYGAIGFADSQIFDNGTNVSVGDYTPDTLDYFTIKSPLDAGNTSILSLINSTGNRVLQVNSVGNIYSGVHSVTDGSYTGDNTIGGNTIFYQLDADVTDSSKRFCDFIAGDGNAGYMRLWDGHGGIPTRVSAVSNDDSYINNGGNFGIGTASPNGRLHSMGADASATKNFIVSDYTNKHLFEVLNSGSIQAGQAYNNGYNNYNFIDFISPSAYSTTQRFSIGFNSQIYMNWDTNSTIPGRIHLGNATNQYYNSGEISKIEVNAYDNSKNLGWIWDIDGSNYVYSLISTDGSNRFFSVNQHTGSIGMGTTTPNPNAVLELASTTKGALLPRMTTTQKTSISSPTEGMEVYDLTLHQKSYYNGTTWINL